jgi:hypothetical protein
MKQDDRDVRPVKTQRRMHSPSSVKVKGLERLYSLYTATDNLIEPPSAAHDQEDSKETSRIVIDLTGLDEPPVQSSAQAMAGPSTRPPTESLSRPPPPIVPTPVQPSAQDASYREQRPKIWSSTCEKMPNLEDSGSKDPHGRLGVYQLPRIAARMASRECVCVAWQLLRVSTLGFVAQFQLPVS